MTIGIYCYRNKINDKRYIGQSIDIERRYVQHEIYFKKDIYDKQENEMLWKSIKKYGRNSFEFFIVEECKEKELNEKETFYINELNSHISKNGYNFTFGGYDRTGYKHSEERKRMIKNNHANFSGENNPNFGLKRSAETIDKFIKSTTGKKKKGKSKYHGVSVGNRKSGKINVKIIKYWVANFRVNKKSVYIGFSKSEIEAAKMYDRYIIENRLNRPLNFPE